MNLYYGRLLASAKVAGNDGDEVLAPLDLGGYSELHLVVTVEEAGDGVAPALEIKHAAECMSGTWLAFATPVTVALDVKSTTWYPVPSFTRWVSASISGTVSSAAVVTLDLVGKG